MVLALPHMWLCEIRLMYVFTLTLMLDHNHMFLRKSPQKNSHQKPHQFLKG